MGNNPVNAVDPFGLYEFSPTCKQKQKTQIDQACPVAQHKADIAGVGKTFSDILEKTTFNCSSPNEKFDSDCGLNYNNTIYLINGFNKKHCGSLERVIGHEVSHSPPFNYNEDSAFIFEYALFGGKPVDPDWFRKEYYNHVTNKEMFNRYDDFYYNMYLPYLK